MGWGEEIAGSSLEVMVQMEESCPNKPLTFFLRIIGLNAFQRVFVTVSDKDLSEDNHLEKRFYRLNCYF